MIIILTKSPLNYMLLVYVRHVGGISPKRAPNKKNNL